MRPYDVYDVEEADSVSDGESRSTWARPIAQVYEVDPLVCPRCSAPMREIAAYAESAHPSAVITEPEEVRKDPDNLRLLQPAVVRHLVKIGRSPPAFDPASLN